MARLGRAPKLTPEVQQQIVSAIELGNTYKTAAGMAGIDEATFYRWMEKGQVIEGEPVPLKLYSDFREAVTRANSRLQSVAVGYWRLHMKDDWRAARDFLRYRFGDEWKSVDRREHTGADGGPIGVAVLDDIMEGEETEG